MEEKKIILLVVVVISFELYKKQFWDKIVSVLDMKIIKDIFFKLHTNININSL